MLDSALPSAIALTIRTRKGDIPAAVIVAAAIVNVIRRRAANQFRKSGAPLVSQPSIAQKR
jgi:apolipoprotein N-acyltransferase